MSVKLFIFIVLFGISYTLAFPTELASSSIVEHGGDVIIIIRKARQSHQPQLVEGVKPSRVDAIDEQIFGKNMGTDLKVDAMQDGQNTVDGTPNLNYW